MTIDKIDPVFAESGLVDSEETFNAKAGGGLVDEPLRYKFLNKALQRIEQRVNSLLEGGVLPFDGTEADHMKQLYTSDLGSTFIEDSENVLRPNTAGENYLSDMCFYRDASGVKHLVAVEAVGGTLDDFNLETKQRTQHDLSSRLPTPTYAWIPCSVCTDGEFLYVLFADHNTSTEYNAEHYIHSFSVTDYSVNPGWAATGTDVNTFNDGSGITGNIIYAADGVLALNANWDELNNLKAISTWSAVDGTHLTNGIGDCTLGNNDYARNTITSDGTYLYFVGHNDGTGYDQIASRSISDGSVGCGGTGWPKTAESSEDITMIQAAAGNIVYIYDTSLGHYWCASPENADLGRLELTTNYGDDIHGLGFDGINYWGLTRGHNSHIGYLVKLSNIEAQRDGTDYTFAGARYWPVTKSSFNFGTGNVKLIFDGSDFYYPGGFGEGASGIFRFPKARLR